MSEKRHSVRKQENQKMEINCFSCSHFYITYDADFPYGCRAAGFKSRLMPSKEMFIHSELECQFFAEKEKKRRRRIRKNSNGILDF